MHAIHIPFYGQVVGPLSLFGSINHDTKNVHDQFYRSWTLVRLVVAGVDLRCSRNIRSLDLYPFGIFAGGELFVSMIKWLT